MLRSPFFKNNPKAFVAALHLQVMKYMSRCGRKDGSLQEYEKALWYLKFLVAYIKSNHRYTLRVEEVDDILKEK